ncbi:hypothetical protein L6258_01855 [Candidatus Parcubacteria bacterium]|nr:hypothetical protein [Candidatus Parcubacteria bacterium]
MKWRKVFLSVVLVSVVLCLSLVPATSAQDRGEVRIRTGDSWTWVEVGKPTLAWLYQENGPAEAVDWVVWDLGDATFAVRDGWYGPTHVWMEDGVYTITARITWEDGDVTTVTRQVAALNRYAPPKGLQVTSTYEVNDNTVGVDIVKATGVATARVGAVKIISSFSFDGASPEYPAWREIEGVRIGGEYKAFGLHTYSGSMKWDGDVFNPALRVLHFGVHAPDIHGGTATLVLDANTPWGGGIYWMDVSKLTRSEDPVGETSRGGSAGVILEVREVLLGGGDAVAPSVGLTLTGTGHTDMSQVTGPDGTCRFVFGLDNQGQDGTHSPMFWHEGRWHIFTDREGKPITFRGHELIYGGNIRIQVYLYNRWPEGHTS